MSTLALSAVFALALAARLVFVLAFNQPQDFVFSDMWVYDHRARNLLAGTLGAWDTFTPVGYPAFVALIYWASAKSALAVGVVQAFLGAATAALLTQLAGKAFRASLAASIVGAVFAFHPPSIFYSGYLLTEVLFTFLLVAAAGALVASAGASRPGWGWALSGLCFGCAATVRPNLLAFFPFLPVLLWLAVGRRRLLALRACAVVAAALAVPTGAAALHNSRLLGRAASLGTNGGLNFYLNLAEVRGVRFVDEQGTHRVTPLPNLYRYRDEELVDVPLYEDGYFYARGLQLLRAEPARLAHALVNLVEAAGMGQQSYWPAPAANRALRWQRRLFCFLGVLPSLGGMLLLLARRRWAEPSALGLVLAAALLASSLVPIAFFLGDPRLRVPFDPFVIVLAVSVYAWLTRSVYRAARGVLERSRLARMR